MKLDYVIFASGGNDSVALVAWAKNKGFSNVAVVHSNTGWASPDWSDRISSFRRYVFSCGFYFHEILSEGFENMVRRKKGFPANKPKFCTYELKIKPAMAWLDINDPNKDAVCIVGVRREESAARRDWPEYLEESPNHGGRPLWSPLAPMSEKDRDALIVGAGWDVLHHRSRECSPCVNSNRADFRRMPELDIAKVERLEYDMHRTMFRVRRFHGAFGIREIMRWAWSEHGRYEPPDDGCDSGMCGG